MNILVVYDSMYGNTEKIAQAIGTAIGATVLHVNQVKEEHLTGLDILIVGSPTQAFQPLKPVKTFLKDLPAGSLKGVKIASFDTRADLGEVGSKLLSFLVKLFGYAAEPIQAKLVRKGGIKVTTPAGFFVHGKEGPLKEGEIERALQWGKQMIP
jgi:flavodoxin